MYIYCIILGYDRETKINPSNQFKKNHVSVSN